MAAYYPLPPRAVASAPHQWFNYVDASNPDGDDPMPIRHFAAHQYGAYPAQYAPGQSPMDLLCAAAAMTWQATQQSMWAAQQYALQQAAPMVPYPTSMTAMAPIGHGAPIHFRASTVARAPVRDYKDDLYSPPLPLEGNAVAIPPISERKIVYEEHDHPSWRRPPVPGHTHHSPPSRKSLDSATGTPQRYATPPESPDSLPVHEVQVHGEDEAPHPDAGLFVNADLIPAGPFPPPVAPALADSAYPLVDATAAVLLDRFSARFGAIGAPKPVDPHSRAPSAEALEATTAYIHRGTFIQFARRVLSATLVSPGVVTAAVSYLLDDRVRKELSVRSLELSFVAALSIANKISSDNAYSTTTWATAAQCAFEDIFTAERGILYAIDFDVQLTVEKAELLIDAARAMLDRSAPESDGRLVLIDLVDSFFV